MFKEINEINIKHWKHFLLDNIGVDIFELIWANDPKTLIEWSDILRDIGVQRRVGVIAKRYAEKYGYNDKEVFNLFSDLLNYKTFIGYKREQRALKWLKKAHYEVSKTSKYEDIFKMYDLYAEKDGIKYAIQVKGNTIKGIESELYEFIITARKDNLVPMIILTFTNYIQVSHTKLIEKVENIIKNRNKEKSI